MSTDYPSCLTHDYPEPPYQKHKVEQGPHRLCLHHWQAPKPHSTLILLHGIGLHGGPYQTVARAFCARGVDLYMPDLRGHGESDGPRAVLPTAEEIRSDYRHVVEFVRGRVRTPVYLGGESMGGLLAADYASVLGDTIDGLILLCPAFRVHRSRFIPRGLSQLHRGMIHINSRAHLEPSTRVQGFVEAKLTDPLATAAVYPGYLLRIAMLGWRWPKAGSNVTLPLQLHLPGVDRIIDARRTRKIVAGVATAADQQDVVDWDGAYHTLFWDPRTEDVIQSMSDWMQQRSEN